MGDLARVAGALDRYRVVLRNINIRPDGDKYIILLRDVRHIPGRPHGLVILLCGLTSTSFGHSGARTTSSSSVLRGQALPEVGSASLRWSFLKESTDQAVLCLLLGTGTETQSSVHF